MSMRIVMQRFAMIASLLFMTRCGIEELELEKVKGPTITSDFALKMGSITYTVGELVDDIQDESVEIVEGEDFSLSFIYNESLTFSNSNDFITIGDISNSESFSPFTSDIPATPLQVEIAVPTREFDFEFQPNDGEEVDSVFFKSGSLEFSIMSAFTDVTIAYELTLIDVREADNQPVVFSNVLAAGVASDHQEISLEGIKNVSERVGDLNIFRASLDLTITVPEGVAINSEDALEVGLVFKDPQFSAVFGNFGTTAIDVQQDTIKLGSFDDFNSEGLALRRPSISMDIQNTFGVEMGLQLGEIRSFNAEGLAVTLSGSVVDNVQFVDAPNEKQVGEQIGSVIEIDVENSNIDDLLNIVPQEIVFEVSAVANPAGSDNLNNYLLDSSRLSINTRLEVPLEFRMNGFSRDFEFEVSTENLVGAESLSLSITTENEIPFNGTLNLAFVNDTGEELLQLTDLAIISSPELGLDERITSASVANEIIALDEVGINAFLQSSKVIATLNIFTFESDQGAFVKIFSDYQLKVDLAISGKVTFDL